ncbi:3-oxoacyl-[acyl-carrier-protein] synthase, mitochondrial [Agrilus planipennis]|uniref:3-oxoacyl-[acyl-carrier-protein] synthase n=1 Tax=Agrilus planipennis TaxID=224129 RepID=A0A7F5R8S1_AGRPL|nr:3-oxoacyl-[acyl-carrier-protein] synthase, mitochondrial [Agrilus planipennis]
MRRRVVVTGMEVLSPVGCNLRESWHNVINGKCGIKQLKEKEYENLPCKVAACINESEFNVQNHFSKTELRSMSLATSFALLIANEALKDAKWIKLNESDLESTGVAVGMGMVDLRDICETNAAFCKGTSKVSPYFVPRILPNMSAGQISIKYGFRGPNHSVSTACATGAHAVGDSFRFIRNGDADVMVCGGTEACISPLAIAGFCRLRALSTSFNDDPTHASRPFDKRRDGFVMGEGCAILVLEELEHAKRRNARVYAEILGYGLSGDASHLTTPKADGSGAVLSMQRALKDALIDKTQVSYVNAHATSTPIGDAIEAKAIDSFFGEYSKNVAVSSTKGAHGHLLGAAGNLEAVFTIKALQEGILPPTINLEEPVEGVHFDFVTELNKKWHSRGRRIALKNAFGFGGTNATLCLAQFEE